MSAGRRAFFSKISVTDGDVAPERPTIARIDPV
jgi:hypothetical protein